MEKKQTKVVLHNCNNYTYPDPPFNPPEIYPEYPFKNNTIKSNNFVYDSIRSILNLFEFDKNNYDTNMWNPLGEFIKPNDNVLIKPNLVRHYNPLGFDTDSMITHGSIVRVVLDYVYIAVKNGTITIGDAPLQTGDFNKLLKLTGINEIINFYNENSDVKIKVIDFRKERGFKNKSRTIINREELEGDSSGYTVIDLKNDSELFEIGRDYKKFRVTNYNKEEMIEHHTKNKHEYLIPNSVLDADVIINLPKLKTHRKAGMTGGLKNMVGINGHKDWLPHHRVGSLEESGDEYLHKSMRKKLLTILTEKVNVTKNNALLYLLNTLRICIGVPQLIYPYKDSYFEGSWWGNNTIPKTIIDLNKIIFYADKNGLLQNEKQRTCFTIVDAIIAGEGEGPLEPTPKECGLLIAGFNPVAVDLVCSEVMGFDYNKIPTIIQAMDSKKYNLFNQKIDGIEIISNNGKCKKFNDIVRMFNCRFKPSKGWNGHIEK